MSNNKLTYEDLEKVVEELEAKNRYSEEIMSNNVVEIEALQRINKENKEEIKNLRWYKSEYDKVQKLENKVQILKKTVKELVEGV